MGLITMMRTKVENTDQFGLLILDNVLNIWGIYCQQGLAGIIGIAHTTINILNNYYFY